LSQQVVPIEDKVFSISSIKIPSTDDLIYVFISESSENIESQSGIENVIRNFYENPHILGSIIQYIFDDVIIVDGQGVLRWRVPNYKEIYGVEEDILGKTIFEIEAQKIFYPSATVKALKEKRRVTLVNQYKNKNYQICTAIPVFNKQNEIGGVISYSYDVTEFMEIKKQYTKLEAVMARYSSEIEALRKKEMHFPEIIRKSPQMENIIELALKVAPVDANLLITGNRVWGKT